MRSRHLLTAALALAAATAAACRPRGPQLAPAGILTRAEIDAAMRPGGRYLDYAGDGTPRGDSLARIASTGATQLEGGSFNLADRYYRYAIRHGFDAGRVTPGHLLHVAHYTLEPQAWIAVLDAAIARGATAPHVAEARARLERRVGGGEGGGGRR